MSLTGGSGGGLFHFSGPGRVVNALFAGNAAANNNWAAVFLYSTGNVELLHVTIAGPALGNGSAIYVSRGTVGITDSIVASYTTGITVGVARRMRTTTCSTSTARTMSAAQEARTMS